MAYCEVHTDLIEHGKTEHLAALLDIPIPCAVGHLVCLWLWAMTYAPDGDLTKFPAVVIARKARFTLPDTAGSPRGNPAETTLDPVANPAVSAADAIVSALHTAGWIDRMEGGRLVLHDWDKYGGKLHASRVADRERKNGIRKSAGNPPEIQRKETGPLSKSRESELETPQLPTVTGESAGSPQPGESPLPPAGEHPGTLLDVQAFIAKGRTRRRPKPNEDPRLTAFLATYPKSAKDLKAVARAWKKSNPDDATVAAMLAAVEKHVHDPQWAEPIAQNNPVLICDPAVYLNQGRWQWPHPMTPGLNPQATNGGGTGTADRSQTADGYLATLRTLAPDEPPIGRRSPSAVHVTVEGYAVHVLAICREEDYNASRADFRRYTEDGMFGEAYGVITNRRTGQQFQSWSEAYASDDGQRAIYRHLAAHRSEV